MTARRPVIGVTAGHEKSHVRSEELLFGVAVGYEASISAAGGAAVLLPTVAESVDAVKHLDGLLLTGGPDVEPGRYGATDVDPTVESSPERDEAEIALLEAALRRDLPILGICRGIQLLAVYFGGDLHQHLPAALGHEGHRPGGRNGLHEVVMTAGSMLSELFGERRREVNSEHHQGVRSAGSLMVTARSPDGLIEGIERDNGPFLVGVQWHPERRPLDGPLFWRFVQDAMSDRCRRSSWKREEPRDELA